MRLHITLFSPESAFISMFEDEQHTAFIVYGQDEARRVLQHVPDDENTIKTLMDLERVLAIETAPRLTQVIKGASVITLRGMIDGMGDRFGIFVPDPTPHIYCCFTATDPKIKDGIIGFCDEHGQHHLAIFYSKKQGLKIIDAMRWLPKQNRLQRAAFIKTSGLPKRSTQSVVELTGQIAGLFNCAYALKRTKQHARSSMN